jgi:hypothetical protein
VEVGDVDRLAAERRAVLDPLDLADSSSRLWTTRKHTLTCVRWPARTSRPRRRSRPSRRPSRARSCRRGSPTHRSPRAAARRGSPPAAVWNTRAMWAGVPGGTARGSLRPGRHGGAAAGLRLGSGAGGVAATGSATSRVDAGTIDPRAGSGAHSAARVHPPTRPSTRRSEDPPGGRRGKRSRCRSSVHLPAACIVARFFRPKQPPRSRGRPSRGRPPVHLHGPSILSSRALAQRRATV